MESNTSTEFLECVAFLHIKEWEERSKYEYYLAQIAAEVRRCREMLSSKPQNVSTSDYLMPIKPATTPETITVEAVKVPNDVTDTRGRKAIEPGPEAVKDPKWAKVNETAKAVWGIRLKTEL